MRIDFPSAEFNDAVAAVCHGTATEAEMGALNELLRTSPAARDEYLLRIELHTRLASEPDLFVQDDAVASVGAARVEPDDRCTVLSSEPSAPAAGRRHLPVLAWAACFLLVAAGVWGLGWKWFGTRKGATSTAVAMLTRTVDARWDPSTDRPRVGSALKPGWLRLKSGLAQVVFYSGARLVIEGPSELQLVSAREAACPQGRLLVEVPEPARGFRIRTDRLDVVDLGTSFGIDAGSDRTEVHVFNGQVEVLRETRGKQSLKESEAVVVQGNHPPRLAAASEAAFASMFEFQQRSLAAEAFRYERWQFANARLNQDPTLVVHLDFENLTGTDWTLHNAAEKNRSVRNATVVGCVRAEGRWREKQALEFQSVNDRVRLAVPGEFDSLTLWAWVCIKGLDRKFNSLFSCDQFEAGTIHWLIRHDGVLGLTVFGPGPQEFQILASPPVLALGELGVWQHLAVALDGRNRQVVLYLNGDPISRHALRVSPPFRIGAAELGNWNGRGGPDASPVLIRSLTGAFDEFGLFSRALSDAEMRELYTIGKPNP
ncbi:MAG: LamG-like jellyroll fold domain-containing protein [Verrucomicrobiia bacterium]